MYQVLSCYLLSDVIPIY